MKSGFTIIELILVVAILGIIGVLSASFYSRFLLQNSLANSVDQISGSLRKAQMYSMMSKQNDGWSVNYSSNTITLYKGNNFASRNTAYDEKFTVNPNVSISGLTNINFARYTGLPTPTSATISITGNGVTENITMNSQGVVSK